MQDLVKHTHPSHPDAVSLRAGLEKIQWSISQVDQAKTKNETKKQRGRLQHKFLEPAAVSVRRISLPALSSFFFFGAHHPFTLFLDDIFLRINFLHHGGTRAQVTCLFSLFLFFSSH